MAVPLEAIQEIPRFPLDQQASLIVVHGNLVSAVDPGSLVDNALHGNFLAKLEHRDLPQALVLDIDAGLEGRILVFTEEHDWLLVLCSVYKEAGVQENLDPNQQFKGLEVLELQL